MRKIQRRRRRKEKRKRESERRLQNIEKFFGIKDRHTEAAEILRDALDESGRVVLHRSVAHSRLVSLVGDLVVDGPSERNGDDHHQHDANSTRPIHGLGCHPLTWLR